MLLPEWGFLITFLGLAQVASGGQVRADALPRRSRETAVAVLRPALNSPIAQLVERAAVNR